MHVVAFVVSGVDASRVMHTACDLVHFVFVPP